MTCTPTVIENGAPANLAERAPKEQKCYALLDRLGVPYRRADHAPAATMELCREIETALGCPICKNLLLTNRQQTDFYLLLMEGDKVFKTKYLSKALGCARLSFADAGHMDQYLRTIPGSVSALELLFDRDNRVQLVIDRDLLGQETVSGHPGFSTSTVRLSREDMLRYVRAVGHEPVFVDLPVPTENE
jgi:Ala-tRNA(Pro) deacylase